VLRTWNLGSCKVGGTLEEEWYKKNFYWAISVTTNVLIVFAL